mmetsp:Transcript_9401/g.27136  ORF Transcript_9401/g.27136 Transcript_9401/m.27136 type:complete len:347 (-) Transcript_9401:596-1636(-)
MHCSCRIHEVVQRKHAAFSRRQVQRGPCVVIALVHIKPCKAERLEHFNVPGRRCVAQLSSSKFEVKASTLAEQVGRNNGEAASDGILDWCRVPTVFHIYIGLARCEECHDWQVPFAGGQVQGGASVVVAGVRVDAKVKQLLHPNDIAIRRLCAQFTRRVGQLHAAAVLLRKLRGTQKVVLHSVLHWRAAPTVLDVGVAGRLEQRLEDLGNALARRQVHRRASIVVGTVRIHTLLQELLDLLGVPLGGCESKGRVHRFQPCPKHLADLLTDGGLALSLRRNAVDVPPLQIQMVHGRHISHKQIVLPGDTCVQLIELQLRQIQSYSLRPCPHSGREKSQASEDYRNGP